MRSSTSLLTQTDFRFSSYTISQSKGRLGARNPDMARRAGTSSRVFAALMFVAAILFLLLFPPACAQGITGSMTGTVADSSGAVIVGATLNMEPTAEKQKAAK